MTEKIIVATQTKEVISEDENWQSVTKQIVQMPKAWYKRSEILAKSFDWEKWVFDVKPQIKEETEGL